MSEELTKQVKELAGKTSKEIKEYHDDPE